MAYTRIEQSSYSVLNGSDKIFIPNLSIHGFSSDPNSYIWTIGTSYSNFSESDEEFSNFSVSIASGGLNERHIGIKVTNIKEGEVVFVPISITVSNGGESASYTAKATITKGKARTTPITIKGIKNGRLVYTNLD